MIGAGCVRERVPTGRGEEEEQTDADGGRGCKEKGWGRRRGEVPKRL